jgi:phosphoglycolate phosphatase
VSQGRLIVQALLFDLDGTLVDSAPDLAGAGNDMRVARGLAPHPLSHYRPMVGSGARGMVARAFGVGPDDLGYDALRDEFLQRYQDRLTQESQVFPSVMPMLAALNRHAIPWGIVTNKATRYSEPLVAALSGLERAATLVCGDTTPHAKPHPAPLLEAARRMGLSPRDCAYVGDDLRDVVAGRAANMASVAVGWGYLGDAAPIEAWGADHCIQAPDELLKLLHLA